MGGGAGYTTGLVGGYQSPPYSNYSSTPCALSVSQHPKTPHFIPPLLGSPNPPPHETHNTPPLLGSPNRSCCFLKAPPQIAALGIPLRYLAAPTTIFGEPPQKQLPQTRQLRALAGSATFLAAPPNAPTPRRPAGHPRSGQLPVPSSTPRSAAAPASCTSLAKRPPPPAMSVLTPTSGSSAQCLRASAPVRPPRRWKTSQPAASFSDGHPSTHGAGSRSGTGMGRGPTSAWLFRRHRSSAAPSSTSAPAVTTAPTCFAAPPFRSTAAPPHSSLTTA